MVYARFIKKTVIQPLVSIFHYTTDTGNTRGYLKLLFWTDVEGM